MDLGDTIRDVILRITGDGDDARRELERLSLELTKFGSKDAEANAKIDTAKAKENLKELEVEFKRIDGRDLSATANVRLGSAMAELAALQAELDHLDGDDVTIDVNVRKDLEERLQSLGMKAAGFADNLEHAADKGEGLGKTLDGTNVQMGFFSSKLGTILQFLPLLIPLASSVLSVVVALGASFLEAAAGAGALAVALGGALVAAAGIGVAAFFRFKETMETAGTPAHRIVEVVGKIGEALQGLSKAADPILHAVAANIGGVFDVIEKVKPAFFAFGKVAGQAVGWLSKALTSPGMANGIAKLLELSGPVLKPLVQILVRFGRILLNIANATMPFLTSALQGLAKWLGEVVKGTSNITKTHGVIGVLVGQLESWWNLLVQIAGVFVELTKIAAPFGKGIVDALAKGAEHLKEWLGSKEGTERVQSFFKDTLPVARELAIVIGQVVVIFLQFGQLMAPIVAAFLNGFNFVLGVIRNLLELFTNVDRALAFKNWGSAISAIAGAFSDLWGAVVNFVGGIPGFIGDKLSAAKDAVSSIGATILAAAVSVFGSVLNAAQSVWGSVRDAIVNALQDARDAVASVVHSIRDTAVNAWQSTRDAAANVWQAVRTAIANAIQGAREAVANAVQSMRDVATNVWQGIRDAAGNIFQAVRSTIANALQAARDAVASAVQGMRDVATTVWQAIRDAAASIFGNVKEAIANALNSAKEVVSNAVQGMLSAVTGAGGAFYSAGKAIIQNMIDGIKSMAEEAVNAVKGVLDKATDLLPGSEPKDPSSPMRNLGRRGRAIIGNLIGGIRESGPDLVKAMSEELAGVAAAGPVSLTGVASATASTPAGAVGAAMQRAAAATVNAAVGGGGLHVENLNVVPMAAGGSPDPDVLAAQLTMALRARATT